MIFGSVCSGIEAASVAWHPLGWGGAFVSEIEALPCAVLGQHWPKIPNLGDLTAPDFIDRAKACGPIDLLVGGTPCQSFSVAGMRRSLEDERGNLTLRFLEVLHGLAPRWFVWENVPGVLNTKDNAFGCFLAGAVGADAPLQPFDPEQGWPCAGVATGPRYGLAWRVLDAQYFGVPQLRRRVFVVGHLGDWSRAAQVLLEPGGVSRDIEAGGEEGEDLAPCLRTRANSSHRADTEAFVAHTLRAEGHDASEDGTGRGTPLVFEPRFARNGRGAPKEVCPPLKAESGKTGKGDSAPVVFQQNSRSEVRDLGGATGAVTSEPGAQCQNYLKAGMAVRRLTPRECERLQGFPDDYTLIPYRGKPAADGPRYKALGNSMAVPVMFWIGDRIEMVARTSTPPPAKGGASE